MKDTNKDANENEKEKTMWDSAMDELYYSHLLKSLIDHNTTDMKYINREEKKKKN